MFALSDACEHSFSHVPYLKREEKITDQSNFQRKRKKKWPITDWRVPDVFARDNSAQFLCAFDTDLTIRGTQRLFSVKYLFEEANVAQNFLQSEGA